MTESVMIQLIVSLTTIAGTVAAVVKYLALQTKKREQALLDHTRKSQEMMLEYFEKKNGHMERMADKFTKSNDKLSKSINKLALSHERNRK